MSGHLRFCFAAFVILAGLSATSASSQPFSSFFNADSAPAAAPAAAEVVCLSQPGKSADGLHWVYRVEGRRRCWFQVAEGAEALKSPVRRRAARDRIAKYRVTMSEESRTAAYKRKAAVDARAELPRSAPEEASRPSQSASVQVVDGGPVVATGIATHVSPDSLSKRANGLRADEITPRQVDVEALLAATPAASDVVAASVMPLVLSSTETGDDGWGWTWLGMLLMALGLVSILSASRTIRWDVPLHQLRSSFARQKLLLIKAGPRGEVRRSGHSA